MKDTLIQPLQKGEDIVVEFSAPAEIGKRTFLTVPNQFKAVAYINESIAFRIEPCPQTNVAAGWGKEYIGKTLKVAFFKSRPLPLLAWGFGNIQVNNERLKEAYRVGANGKYTLSVCDYVKLINAFNYQTVTLDLIREKTVTVVKNEGIPILSGFFANTNLSVFEISAHSGELKDKLLARLNADKTIPAMGLKVEALTVEGIHVNEDDLRVIRDRINEEERQ